MAIFIGDCVKESAYYALLETDRDYYYRVYCDNASGPLKTKDNFFQDVLVPTYLSGYAIDHESTGELRPYRAHPEGGYVYDPDGSFFQVQKMVQGNVIEIFYAHRSQLFKPVEYIQKSMGVIALILAITFQNTQIQLAQLADYVREAQTINAKISRLNELYADLNVLLSNFEAGNRHAATRVCKEQKFWEKMVEFGLIDSNFFVCTSMKFRPILLAVKLQSSPTEWLAFSLHYSKANNNLSANRYNRIDGHVNTKDDAISKIRGEQEKYTDLDDLAAILTLTNKPLHFGIDTYSMATISTGGTTYYDYLPDSRTTQQVYERSMNYGEKNLLFTDSYYNSDSRNDVPFWPTDIYADKKTSISDIITAKQDSVVCVWDVRKYIDTVRTKIDCINNEMQSATTRIGTTNQSMQTNFSTATGVINNAGGQLTQVVKNIRG
jgi:hypothetical protein